MHFENGGSLVKFPVATSETYTNREGQKVTNTDWHSVVINAKGLVD
ncbi:MAG TPA: single-stranded DNA-binding protein, partial [Cryomorphaceae bacterium]|nr:single-stranded DNA-binding protein [Cryomorphaceae bacterium]